ncbi:phage tail tape measure protein [Ornithinibacillus sp. JPR2-1]|uniref:phage tail tape measure protein n=1 Tax=Ornithinibacillus sp. JPR2-1 TaxID=2094019 RepID=UPI0031D40095
MAAKGGEIRARLVLSNDEFKRKMNEAREDMKSTRLSAKQMKSDFDAIQKASLAVGTAVVAGIGSSAKVAMDFEQSMARVKAISGATGEEFKLLENAARGAGATTVFSASQASDALSYLAMAGFDVNQQIAALPSVLNAAAAGQIGLAESADLVSNIMTGFGISADNTNQAVDVLVKTMTTANTDLPMLAQGMKYVAPVASSLGLSIEETAAAIGRLSDAGIQGSQSGTVLRAALLSLANPTGQTAKAMERLKIEVTDADGKMKSFPELIGHISEKMEGMEEAQRTQTAAQLVGTEAAAGFLALLKVGEDGLRDYTKELENSAGTAERIAAVQNDTLIGSFKEFQSAMEELGIKIGNEFLPIFKDIVETGIEVVRTITELDSSTIKSGLAFAGTTAAIALTITTIGKLVLAIRGLMLSMGPAGWLITGVSLLGGALAGAAFSTEDLQSKIERLSQEFDELESLDATISEFDNLQMMSRLTNDEFARYIDLQTELQKTSDPEVIAAIKDEMAELEKRSGFQNGELDRMVELNNDLVKVMPEATSKITDQGNAIIGSTDALKNYSKEKLESLYTDLELTRLATEVEYKETLEKEAKIINDQQKALNKLNELQDKRVELQQGVTREEEKLEGMLANKQLYHEVEIQNQRSIVKEAERLLDKNEQQIADQATKIQGNDTELAQIREEIQGYEEIRFQMIDILLKQEGLTAERGQGLAVVQDELKALREERDRLIENTDAARKNTDEYKEAKKAIDTKIERLKGVENQILDITRSTSSMNEQMSRPINKNVSIIWNGTTPPPHLRGATPLPSYHTGGIVEKPKLHTGGTPDLHINQLESLPLHNEIDVRLLRDEMVLTKGQQANLWRIIESGVLKPQGNGEHWSQVIRLLEEVAEGIREGKDISILMDSHKVGSLVEPHVTKKQKRDKHRKNLVKR